MIQYPKIVLMLLLALFLITTPSALSECQSCDECSPDMVGMKNPAAVYCAELGYEYKIIQTEAGERGICVIPDTGEEFDAWAFLEGKVGQEYSYCALNGYDMKTMYDGNNPFSCDYAVCIEREPLTSNYFVTTSDNSMSVTELMNLKEKVCVASFPTVESSNSWITTKQSTSETPPTFDWRDKDGENWITTVKCQGCGDCWAFAAVGGVEAKYNIYLNDPDFNLNLSEQYLVSDCFQYGDCSGGIVYYALEFIKLYGITNETCYPYIANNSNCSERCPNWNTQLWTISDFGCYVPDEEIKVYLIEKGPLPTYVSMNGNFDNGTYKCGGSYSVGHAVLLVGYNDTGEYWIVKNSWGAGWNGDGYFNVGYDECGINAFESPFYINLTLQKPSPIPLPTPFQTPPPEPLPTPAVVPASLALPIFPQIPGVQSLPVVIMIPGSVPLPVPILIPIPNPF